MNAGDTGDNKELIFKEILPEERIARLVMILAETPNFTALTMTEMAAVISPYVQLEILDARHQERVLCLTDFYNLREKLIKRERDSFQTKSELIAQILARPEAKTLGFLYDKS